MHFPIFYPVMQTYCPPDGWMDGWMIFSSTVRGSDTYCDSGNYNNGKHALVAVKQFFFTSIFAFSVGVHTQP